MLRRERCSSSSSRSTTRWRRWRRPTPRSQTPSSGRRSSTSRSSTTTTTSSGPRRPSGGSWRRATRWGRTACRARRRSTRKPRSTDVLPGARPPGRLLLVALDDLGVANVSRVRILPRLAERAPLAQKVPGLVERDADRLEPVVLARAQPALADARVELLLFADQLFYAVVNLFVVGHDAADGTRGGPVEVLDEPPHRVRLARRKVGEEASAMLRRVLPALELA